MDLLVGGDLLVASVPDVGRTRGSSWNAGGSLTLGLVGPSSLSLSGGVGQTRSDTLWVAEQTAILAQERLYAGVGGHTRLEGALIAADSGVLLLDTETLSFADIDERIRDRMHDVQVGLSIGLSSGADRPGLGLPGATLSGEIATRDVERVTRATVGPGQIMIRDGASQSQDLAALNRDPDRAQEILRDEAAGVRFYASDTAIRELASGFATTRENLEASRALFERGLSGLTEEIARSVAEAAEALGLSGLSAAQAQEALIAAQLASGAVSEEEAAMLAAIIRAVETGELDSAYAAGGAVAVGGVPVSSQLVARAMAVMAAAGGHAAIAALAGGSIAFAAILASTPAGARIDRSQVLADGSVLRLVGGGSETQLTMSVRTPDGETTVLVLSRMQGGAYALVAAGVRSASGHYVPLDPRSVLNDARALAGAVGGGFQATASGGLILSTPGQAGAPLLHIATAVPDRGLTVSTPGMPQGPTVIATPIPGQLPLIYQNELVNELLTRGVRVKADDVVDIRRLDNGSTVWLETGNTRAGLQHIQERHGADFANRGVGSNDIPRLIFAALERGTVVGTISSGQNSRSVYEVSFNGTTQRLSIGIGSNGFIVTAHPY